MVEEAFRLNVKRSLQELSKAINGDGKSGPNPLFRVKVCLEGDKVGIGLYKSHQGSVIPKYKRKQFPKKSSFH